MKSEKSLRSIKSNRSLRSTRTAEVRRTEIIDLENVLPMACAKFDCSYTVLVQKSARNDEYYRYLKYADFAKKRISLMPQSTAKQDVKDSVVTPRPTQVPTLNTDDASISVTNSASILLNNLTIHSIYDSYNSLAEIRLENLRAVPRVIMRIFVFLTPYYKNLSKITITKCKIDGFTIYELSKIIKVSTVTQICLDGSSVLEANYAILLETDNLRYLSLSRCGISDDVCEQISSRIRMSGSAVHLSMLNLSSNHITDKGAMYIAECLRTNRFLRYLNLADNHITDDGASTIFNVLKEFSLTCGENLEKKKRYFKYLREKQALFFKFYAETTVDDASRKFSKRRKTSLTSVKGKPNSARREKERPSHSAAYDESLRAEMLAKQALGPFVDPFQPDCIKCKDDRIFCLGNMTLCYLNLSYNNLSYASIRSLCDVVSHQRNVRKPPQTGLMKIVIDGNNIPIKCPEMLYISEMLSKIYMEAMRLKRQSIIR